MIIILLTYIASQSRHVENGGFAATGHVQLSITCSVFSPLVLFTLSLSLPHQRVGLERREKNSGVVQHIW